MPERGTTPWGLPAGHPHRYEMESPLNAYYTDCHYQFADGSRCQRQEMDLIHRRLIPDHDPQAWREAAAGELCAYVGRLEGPSLSRRKCAAPAVVALRRVHGRAHAGYIWQPLCQAHSYRRWWIGGKVYFDRGEKWDTLDDR